MKRFLFPILTLLCSLLLCGTALAADATPPAIPTEGDVWDGESTIQPTKLTNRDGVYYYQISSCAELAYIAQTGGDWLTYNYILQNNLILNSPDIKWDDSGNCTNEEALHEWMPIGSSETPFKGSFDGNGFAISGVYIDQFQKSNVGLFGVVGTSSNPATIKNLNVVNSFITGDSSVGGVVGNYNIDWNDRDSIFTNCAFSGFVRAYGKYAGGFVGSSAGGEGFSKLINYGDVMADQIAGGVFGKAGYSNNCYNYGTVSYLEGNDASGTTFGGIAGYGSSYTYCVNYGSVSGISCVGGIYGLQDGGTHELMYCENRGTVSGDDCVGGIAGLSGNERIKSCKNSGIVTGKKYIGGIAGKRETGWYPHSYTITDVYNAGSVSGENYVGGIIGYADENTDTVRAYNIGFVSATGIAGAILCSDTMVWGKCVANSCYYEKAKTPSLFGCGYAGATEDISGIEAKTASELKDPVTYSEYDYFDNPNGWEISGDYAIWKFGSYNNGYPYLSWESKTKTEEVTGINLSVRRFSIGVGDTYYLSVQQIPTTATVPDISWKSSDESVATVDAHGKVVGNKVGTAKISVVGGGFSATCTVTVTARAQDEYRLGTIQLESQSGEVLTAIPKGSFWVSVPLTHLQDSGNAVVMLAAYNTAGQYLGVLCARAEDLPKNSTVRLSLLVDNSAGNVAQVKAFVVPSLSEPTPIGTAVFA